jgi:hypothetical protein
MKQTPVDPNRAKVLELCSDLQDKVITLRDYATTPGNAWLAKGELQSINTLLSEIEMTVEDIKQSDSESR